MSKIKQGTLKILSNKIVDDKHFVLSFENDGINPKAGQFIMIDCISKKARNNSYSNGSYLGPLLKRPFSFFLSSNDKELSIMYQVKEWGKGTGYLTHLKAGDEIYYEGPLGKAIDIKGICSKDETIHLIAGGVGIAPITFLAQKLIHKGYKVQIYFGVKEIGKFLDVCLNYLDYIGVDKDNVMLSVEDPEIRFLSFDCFNNFKMNYRGRSVFKGNMLQALGICWKNIIEESKGPIFICGSEIVMKYVHTLCDLKMKRDCYYFMEEHMACGKGLCNACNVNGKLLCMDGPCFESSEVFGNK